MTGEPEGLLGRIRQMRRSAAPADATAPDRRPASDSDQAADLRLRVAHLEQQLQGLQDSIDRQSQRWDRQIAELDLRIEPATLAAALSKDARERGL
jgi:hypothetical protein